MNNMWEGVDKAIDKLNSIIKKDGIGIIMKETEIAKPIISYLVSMGWDVYQEVMIFGKIADIVAICGKLTWILECKTSLSLKLLEQAYAWRGRANFISIVIPQKSYIYDNSFVNHILKQAGIGVLTVEYKDVRLNISPTFNRKTINIIKYLKPEQKTWLQAGSKGGGYYTPFQETKRSIEYNIIKHPEGILFKEFLKLITYHYRTEATAKNCIIKWIRLGIIKAEIINNNNKLYIYPLKEG